MDDSHQRIRAAVTAFARGELVIVADDDDRENEGDLFVDRVVNSPPDSLASGDIVHTAGQSGTNSGNAGQSAKPGSENLAVAPESKPH